MGSRTWIKIYCDKWLSGTLREEAPEIRSVWIDLLALAGSGRYGDTGEIKIMNDVPLTDAQIAQVLRISLELWQKAKARFIETDRIKVTAENIISIINWGKYQSEYERQRVYRTSSDNRGLQPRVTTKGAAEKEKGEGRGERGEERKRKESSNINKEETTKEEINQVNNLSEEMAEIAQLYEVELGKITPFVAQELNDAIQNYPADWIKGAIKEAVKQNKRKWSYVRGILKHWGTSGSDKYAGQKFAHLVKGMPKDDPDRFVKGKYGHMVQR